MIAADQVYFLHMILMDSDSQTALCLGRTYLVGADGAEPLNAPDLDLVENRLAKALTVARGPG